MYVESMYLVKTGKMRRGAGGPVGWEEEGGQHLASEIYDKCGGLLQIPEALSSCLNTEHLTRWQIQWNSTIANGVFIWIKLVYTMLPPGL